MGSKYLHLWHCHECQTPFRITHQESLHAAGVKCPSCGSRFVHHDKDQRSNAVRASGFATSGSAAVGVPIDHVTKPRGCRGSERAEVRSARRAAKLSTPSKYREVVLRKLHEQHVKRKADQERARRERDFKPL